MGSALIPAGNILNRRDIRAYVSENGEGSDEC